MRPATDQRHQGRVLRRRFLSKTTAFRQFLTQLSPVFFSKRVTQSHATYLDTYPNQWLLRTVGFLEHLIQQLCWAGCRNLGSVRTCRPATVYCIYVCIYIYMYTHYYTLWYIDIYIYILIYIYIYIYCVCVYTHRYNILSNYVYYMNLHLENFNKLETRDRWTATVFTSSSSVVQIILTNSSRVVDTWLTLDSVTNRLTSTWATTFDCANWTSVVLQTVSLSLSLLPQWAPGPWCLSTSFSLGDPWLGQAPALCLRATCRPNKLPGALCL